jgi:mannose-6-phosphate isomerase-like protein (cupin superfamily)
MHRPVSPLEREADMQIEPMPIDRQSAEHYTWGTVCDGWHFLKGADLSVIQERVPPGAGEVRHFHSRARQFFYVLAGTATLEFTSHTVTFSAGQGAHVPPTTEHRFCNRSAEDVVLLVISSPTTAGDRTNVGST